MKPSERIHDLAAKHAPGSNNLCSGPVGTSEMVRGLLDYLDEEHERREATRSHFTIIVTPGGDDAREPAEIAKAIQAAVEGVLDGVAQ